MKFRVFSVFDSKAKAFVPPFVLPEVGMAVRTFKDCANDKAHAFGKNPADYSLFSLGSWDDHSGSFTSEVEVVISALELIERDSDPAQLSLVKENVA